VFITDITSGYGQLNIQGPKSRQLLQSLTSVDMSNEAFPFRQVREIDIGLARVMCIRITYAGDTPTTASSTRASRSGCSTPG
jgi:4-methylaminobutanoate oxidase (formaldehyde-forming)